MRILPCLAVLVVLLAGGFAQAPAPTAPDTDAAANKAQLLDLLGRLIPAVEAELARDGADPTDVRALARRLGSPAAAVKFVREEIAFEPYDGVLRGAAGALAARASNSWDKALLLQELLAAMGVPSRLMQVQLDEAQCGQLVDAFLQAAPRMGPAVEEREVIAQTSRMTGIAPEVLTPMFASQGLSAAAAFAATARVAVSHAEMLRVAIKGQAVDGAEMRTTALAMTRHHALLQLDRNPVGEPTATVYDLTPIAAADGTSVVAGAEPVGDLPRHTVRFQLLYTNSAGETPILDVTVDLQHTLDSPLSFQIAPADAWLGAVQSAAMTPTERQAKLKSIQRWQGTLGLGGVRRSSRVFDLRGGLHDVGGDGRIRAAGDLGGAAQRGFDAFGGGDSAAEKTSFVALTMVCTLRTADGSERRFVRKLLDVDAVTRGEQPATYWEILALGGRVDSDYVARSGLAVGLPLWRAMRQALDGEAAAAAALTGLAATVRTPPPVTLLQLQVARQMQQDAIAGRDGLRTWTPDVQLLVLEQRLRGCGDDTGCASVGFDWMGNDVRFLPVLKEGAATAFAAAIEQGAFDTALEAACMEHATPAAGVVSAAHALERARSGGKGLAVKAVAGERLRVEIAGEVVVYEIDPHSGCTVGRLPSGQGGAFVVMLPQALTEFLESQRAAFWSLMCVAPNIVGAATGKRNGIKTAVGLIACVAGFSFRFAGYVAGVQKVKSLAVGLGMLGDFVSGAAAMAGLFI